MRKRKRIGFLSWLSVIFGVMIFMFSSFASQSEEGESFYYSGGKKIPIILDNSRVALKFKRTVPIERVYSFLPKFRQLSAPPQLERQELARSNVYLVSLAQPLTRFNMQAFKVELQRSEEIETVGEVYLFGENKSLLILTDEFVVKFKPEVTREQIERLNKSMNVSVVSESKHVRNQFVLRIVPESESNALSIANQYYENELTEFAHPNFITTFERRKIANDTYFLNQWHLNNTGQDGGKVDADIDCTEAWDITTGDPDIRIAILDDSIEQNHEDLSSNIVAAWDFTDDDDDPSPGPGDYHGTSVAGIAAGDGDNSQGIAGVCYSSRIVAVRLGNELQDFADVFYWAANTGNADIISNSWGLTIPAPDTVVNAINDVASNGRGGKGCVVLFAAGNSNTNISAPGAGELAALDSVIAVGASTNKDVKACYSSWGTDLDVMAPSNTWINGVCPSPMPIDAVGTWSTDQGGTGGFNDGTPPRPDSAGLYTQDFGGTSSACPTAAGVAGLLLSVNPYLTRPEVQDILQATAEKISPNLANYNAQGHSSTYGYGRINAHRAIVPTVIISVEPAKVKEGDPFTVTVTGTAPFGLKAVWWFGEGTGIPDIDQAHWQNVTGDPKVFSHTWTGISIQKTGLYKLGANARDINYPTPGDGYPHQASEGSGIAYAEIEVVPTFAEWAMLISGLLFIGTFIYRKRRGIPMT
jgi:subtilisin family serine protease